MNYRPAVLSLSLLLICYVALFSYLGYWRPEPLWADGPGYVECSRIFFRDHFKVHPTRPFGCALVFGWPFLWDAGGGNLSWYIPSVQFCFWLGTVVVLWRILLTINSRYAHWAVLIFGLNIGALVFSRQINSETPFIFFVTLALWTWLRYWRSRLHRWLIAAFALLCFATLIRPSGQYFVAALLLVSIVRGFYHFYRKKKFSVWLVPGVLVLIFCLTVGVRVAQMSRTYGVFSMTVIQDFDLYVYLAGYSELWHLPDREARGAAWKRQSEMRWAELTNITDSAGYAVSTRFARAAFFQRLREAPFQVVKTYCRNIFSNSVAPSFYIARVDADVQQLAGDMIIRSLQIISRLQNVLYAALTLIVIPFWLIKKEGGFRRTAKSVVGALTSECIRLPFWFAGWLFGLYIILTSAIAFAAGDRLHLAVAPLTIVSVYTLLVSPKNRLFSYN